MALSSALEIRKCSATEGGCAPPDDPDLSFPNDWNRSGRNSWPDRRSPSSSSEYDRPVVDNHTAPARTASNCVFFQCFSSISMRNAQKSAPTQRKRTHVTEPEPTPGDSLTSPLTGGLRGKLRIGCRRVWLRGLNALRGEECCRGSAESSRSMRACRALAYLDSASPFPRRRSAPR